MLKFSRSKSHPIIHTIKPIESGLSIEGYRYLIIVEILTNIYKNPVVYARFETYDIPFRRSIVLPI